MKKIISNIILIGLSSSVFASAGGQIVNERTIAIGNAKNVGFERTEGDAVNIPKFAQANATARSYRGNVGKNIDIFSDHRFMIQNYTSQKQRYHFKYEETCDGEGALHEGDVDVNANSTWHDSGKLHFATNKARESVYTIIAETRVKGETGDFAQDRGTLTVRK